MLAKHGEFYPFGSSMTTDGKIVAHGAYDGDENPPSQQLIDLLTHAFRQQAVAGQIRASWDLLRHPNCSTGSVREDRRHLHELRAPERRSGDICLPYKKGWFGKISYGEIFGAARKREFFA
jgi:hypothetical protein